MEINANIIILVLCLTGCMHSPNYRVFAGDGFVATGALSRTGEGKYYSVVIDFTEVSCSHVPLFAIRTSKGVVLKSNDFSYDKIKGMSDPDKSRLLADGMQSFFMDGFTFIYRDKKLATFHANWIKLPDKCYCPEIGDAEGKRFFVFPLKEDALVELFGQAVSRDDRFVL